MNKIEFSKTNKKAAIVTYNTRLTLDSKHIRSTGIKYMRDYIMNVLNRDVCDILSIPGKDDINRPFYKDIRDFDKDKYDINYYDEIFIYNCQSNVFGGLYPIGSIQTMRTLNKFNGELWYMLTDPAMPPLNFGQHVTTKYKYCDVPGHVTMSDGSIEKFDLEDVKRFTENVFLKTKVAFCGLDYKKYYDDCKPKHGSIERKIPDADWAYFGQHEYYALRELLDIKLQNCEKDEDAYDFVYCGNNRGSRIKNLEEISSFEDLKCCLVGITKSINNCAVEKYMPHEDMFNFINHKSYATLVMGDDGHNNNIITPRFYESMLLNTVAFIYSKYDKDKKFVKNQELKDFIYVDSMKELHDKILQIKNNPELYKHLVKLERKDVFDELGITNIKEFVENNTKNVLNI